MSFLTHEQNGLVWLTSSLLDGVCHGFSTRQGGGSQPPCDPMTPAPGRDDDPAAVRENYRRFCGTLGVDPARTVLSKQVHEATVRLCTEADAGKGLLSPRDYAADALITRDANLPLAVFSADCGILLLYDPIHRAVGAIHAGWRGCAAGIPEKTVQAMTAAFGTRPEDLVAAVGPCIQQCCFETDGDVPAAMTQALSAEAAPYLARQGAKWHVDLSGLNRQWLLRAGLRPERIDRCALCTACRPDLFWSHRKMGEARGAQVAMISLGEHH